MRAAGMIGRVCNMLYGRWYVAPILFVLVAGTLPFLLGGLDAALPNRIVIGKDWSVIVLFAALANLVISAIVAAFRRMWKSFILRLVLLVPAFVVSIFVAFMLVCVPTRMRSSPSDGWVEEKVVKYLPVAGNQLSFCGGINAREFMMVFKVSGESPDWDSLRFDSYEEPSSVVKERYGALFSRFRDPQVLVDPVRMRTLCHSDDGSVINVLESAGRSYVIYRRL